MKVDDIFVFNSYFQLTSTSSIYRTSIRFTPFEQNQNLKGNCHSPKYFNSPVGDGGGAGGGVLYIIIIINLYLDTKSYHFIWSS